MSITLSSDLRRELAQLRARAYGPDADIDVDDASWQRLRELEDLARLPGGDRAADTGSGPDHVADAETGIEVLRHAETSGAEGDGDADTDDDPAQDAIPAERHPFRAWIWGVIALVILLALGLWAAIASAQPRPTYVAVLDPTATVDTTQAWLARAEAAIGVDPDTLEQHIPIEGVTMWTGQAPNGSACIIVVWSEFWGNGECVPAGMPPIVDFHVDGDIALPLAVGLESGSVIRFIARDDVVEIWITEPVVTSEWNA